jgi:hypothetical protein
MTHALLNTRNTVVAALQEQGYDIRGAGMFINGNRYEADICATAPSGEEYHFVIWPQEQPKVATPVKGIEYGPDTPIGVFPTVREQETKAWAELKDVLSGIPAESLYTFFHGDASDRDQLMDDLGMARESWWLLGVLGVEER